ncbi:PKD domain-containing protein [Methanosarcina sp. UBA289]|uniref:PKD domain-containing protein n=1 Tax=Methanosarcina sp. UBA289 TaxID=1915574 RepID=UPI0025E45D23|nr:PKD domain-containing protein [Methanosarcina sp. UBA289]
MNNKKYFNSIILASAALILFLIIVSSTASASIGNDPQNVAQPSIDQSGVTQVTTSAEPKIIETRITTSKTARSPAIYGGRIVWEDWRNEKNDIYMYDFGTKKETRISTSGKASTPAIHRNRIVWADTRSEKSDIYMYDVSTKKQTQITTSGNAYNPKVYDNIILWQDSTSAYEYGNIWMYDLSCKKKTQITKNQSAQMPDIYKNKIVWQDSRNTKEGEWGSDIYIYDFSTKKETKISTSGNASNPAINGNRIVWADARKNDPMSDPAYPCPAETGVYDLSTHKETWIPELTSEVSIYGDKIVGTADTDWDGTYIWIYDLSNNIETWIPDEKPYTAFPKIYGNRIVWADAREEEFGTAEDIYMGTLVYPPVAAFYASPVSGKKPLTVKFTDKSTQSPASWSWNFGDKSTSTAKNPVHKYTKAGKYTVSLTVKNAAGSNTKKISNYITVK